MTPCGRYSLGFSSLERKVQNHPLKSQWRLVRHQYVLLFDKTNVTGEAVKFTPGSLVGPLLPCLQRPELASSPIQYSHLIASMVHVFLLATTDLFFSF